MENDETEYVKGSGDDFIHFIFSNAPKDEGSIKLELDPCPDNTKIGLHIFQELLMIFTGGLKYIFGSNGQVNILELQSEDIHLMNQYFKSFGFSLEVNKFSIVDYLDNMKLPNYFVDQELIEDTTQLRDIYFERTFDEYIFRISFDFLR
uniref:Uncharacterized protein n=1 Tax=viral metagenome TaxID=1070528 RepID=A0A6C0L3T3_9ZZZZ|tara:strand:+ start:16224 stop:16670 length:447 start_codon:yes stop_codon:yes gene_type:complete